jgi:uncharacterized protein
MDTTSTPSPGGPEPTPPPPVTGTIPSSAEAPIATRSEERTWALAAHLSAFAGVIIPFGNLLAPLIIWSIKKDEMPFVNDQGKEAVNFQITITIALVISFVLVFLFIGILLLPIVGIFAAVMSVIAAIKANDGIAYRYPVTIRFIK